MKPPSPNYGLVRPTDGRDGTVDEPMGDFEPQINANWDALASVPAPNSGTSLPQAGSYNVGDRFYKSDTKSIYILVVKSAVWGWHWRPVQDALSPWFTPPATCINDGAWTINPVVANPFAIAYDNRGKCHWRGVIGITAGTFSRNVSHSVLKALPDGLRPRQRGSYLLGHSALSVTAVANNLNSWQGARMFISDDPSINVTIRGMGGSAEFNQVHLGGIVQYAVGTGKYDLV